MESHLPWSQLDCYKLAVMTQTTDTPDRDQLASEYFDVLPFEPYPVQEEALLAYFTSDQGVLV